MCMLLNGHALFVYYSLVFANNTNAGECKVFLQEVLEDEFVL